MTEQQFTEDQQVELIQRFLKTRDAADTAKKALADEKKRLAPFEEARKATADEHATVKRELVDALGSPGAKFNTPAGTASLSRPRRTVVLEVDMDALVEYLHAEHPEIIEKFTHRRDRTASPSLRVVGG